jgi:phosphatidylserine/phosphatidylglycerophosphate/cardiolipin synthase-like enzyme
MEGRILHPGHNCWKIAEADRLTLLFNGNNFFDAFFNVAAKATESIQLVGWELDARVGASHIKREYPDNLRDYFRWLTELKPTLAVHIACWRPAFYLWFDREWFVETRWKLATNSRVHFKQDDPPFIYSSYHEKVSVIDQSCAFLGGIDLTKKRWDDARHLPHHPLRKDERGRPYHAVHDLQLVMSGEVTDLLVELLRPRLKEARDVRQKRDLWPETHAPQAVDIKVAISRTDPRLECFEIERFYFDVLSSAQDYILIENQYFSYRPLIRLLCERLRETDGPEVILILPYLYPGVFENAVFIKERNAAIDLLRAADHEDRLLIVHPSFPDESRSDFIKVHSKLLVADDRVFTVGSANLNYRSMRVDREINVCLEDDGDGKVRDFIHQNLCLLFAEHLSLQPELVAQEHERLGSWRKVIEAYKGQKYVSLRDLPHCERSTFEKCLFWLGPFADIRQPVLKQVLSTGIVLFLILSYFAIKAIA